MVDDAYLPYAPLNTLKPFGTDLWIVDGPEIRMQAAGLGLPFPTRMTVVRLADGLWIHSPIAPDAALFEALAMLGPVRWLVAPNTLHYWWLPDWAERFPQAQAYVAPDLDRRARRPLPPHEVLQDAAPAAWSGQIEQLIARSRALTEVVFFHRASRTLILTDLIENFEPARARSRLLRSLLRWAGAADPDGKAPIDMQLSFFGRRVALSRAVRSMIGWAPERVVLAHGRCYDRDGVTELKRAFRWVL